MKSLRDRIADIIWTATDNYEKGAEPTCGSVADAIMELVKAHGETRMVYLDEIKKGPFTEVFTEGSPYKTFGEKTWQPAKPIGGLRIKQRIKGAWAVLTNRAVAVRWY